MTVCSSRECFCEKMQKEGCEKCMISLRPPLCLACYQRNVTSHSTKMKRAKILKIDENKDR